MITTDWHLHSRNSRDCGKGPVPATMADTLAAIRAAGVVLSVGSDHHAQSRRYGVVFAAEEAARTGRTVTVDWQGVER